MLTSPALPSAAAPLPIHTAPLDPELELPELKLSAALTPFVPEFALASKIVPLEVAEPCPDEIHTPPPVDPVLSPALSVMSPPDAKIPAPADILISPALPDVAVFVPIQIDPEVPEEDTPVLKLRDALTPAAPACGVEM